MTLSSIDASASQNMAITLLTLPKCILSTCAFTCALYDNTMYVGPNYSARIAQREVDAPMLDAIASKICCKCSPSGYCFTDSC